MGIFVLFTAVYLLAGIFWAVTLVKKKPWIMLIGAVLLTMYGGGVAIASSYDGTLLNIPGMYFSGQLLLMFFSIIGGALASTALSEMRKKHNDKLNS